jgi:hypothetical protein
VKGGQKPSIPKIRLADDVGLLCLAELIVVWIADPRIERANVAAPAITGFDT